VLFYVIVEPIGDAPDMVGGAVNFAFDSLKLGGVLAMLGGVEAASFATLPNSASKREQPCD
jgi:hypothetical protein